MAKRKRIAIDTGSEPAAVTMVLANEVEYPVDFPRAALDKMNEVLGGEKWYDQKADLAHSIWALQGAASRVIFGDPGEAAGVRSSNIDTKEWLAHLRLADNRLKSALTLMKAPNQITGATVRVSDLNALIVLVECAIRIIRLLVNAVTTVNQTIPLTTSPDAV